MYRDDTEQALRSEIGARFFHSVRNIRQNAIEFRAVGLSRHRLRVPCACRDQSFRHRFVLRIMRMTVAAEQSTETRHAVWRVDERLTISLIAAAVAFAAAAFAPQILNDGDTFFHVAAGRRMLSDHALLFRDPFSYTFSGTAWEAHEWLAEISMAGAFAWGGWSGLVLVFALAAGATAGSLAYHLGRWLPARAQILSVILALSCMTGSLLARPHLLALPLLEIWAAGLVIARSERRRPSLALLPVMAIWVNIHGSFLLGLALAGALGLEALVSEPDHTATIRSWGVFGGGALLASLCNPHFLQGVLFPLMLTSTSSLGNIGEWQPIDFSRPQPLEFVLLAAIYFVSTRGVTIPASRAALVLGLLYMALRHERHQLLFAVIAPLLLAEPLARNLLPDDSSLRQRVRRWTGPLSLVVATLIGTLLMLRAVLPIARIDGPVAPITALEHVPLPLRAQPVLNDYSFGGYLIFMGTRPYIDSRVELYGDAFLRNYARIIRPDAVAVKTTLSDNKIRWTILGAHSPALTVMDSLAGWHRLYSDEFAVVHIRDKYAP